MPTATRKRAQSRSSATRIILLDDEYDYLQVAAKSVEGYAFDVLTTQDSDEAVQWAVEGRAGTIVSDLTMPGRDGILILEEVHRQRPKMRLALMTGYRLSPDQHRRLNEIGASVYAKGTSFLQLLEDLASSTKNRTDTDMANLVRENRELKLINQQLICHWIAELREIPDFENATIISGETKFTVSELIRDLEEMSPRGREHLNLWLRAFDTLRSLPKHG